jgi:putative phosphoribosyl transferase
MTPSPAVEVVLEADDVRLPGVLTVPDGAVGLVVFAHGSGSSRHSSRNRYVAEALGRARLATLLFDLLTEAEAADRSNVFDIALLARRLDAAARWARRHPQTSGLPLGYFGASTGAAAALRSAAAEESRVVAVVSRGGRPDLAGDGLGAVRAPTLLLVGGADEQVLELNRQSLARLTSESELSVIPGAGHLFEEPGALDQVAEQSRAWFRRHLAQEQQQEQEQ